MHGNEKVKEMSLVKSLTTVQKGTAWGSKSGVLSAFCSRSSSFVQKGEKNTFRNKKGRSSGTETWLVRLHSCSADPQWGSRTLKGPICCARVSIPLYHKPVMIAFLCSWRCSGLCGFCWSGETFGWLFLQLKENLVEHKQNPTEA